MADPICGIDVDALRTHLETDLSDEALERLMHDACDAITDRVGSLEQNQIVLRTFSSDRYLFLPKPIDSDEDIESITYRLGNSELVLAETDWRWIGGRMIERLTGGGESVATSWGWNFVSSSGDVEFNTVVVYTPKTMVNRRIRVLIDLVRLATQYTALASERAGDYSSSSLKYKEERAKLINELVPRLGFA